MWKKTVDSIFFKLFIVFSCLLGYTYITSYPLRFTKSLSLDAKIKFLHESEILKKSNTIVVGSSMALNNINSPTIEKTSQSHMRIANIASWGISTVESELLIKLLDLRSVKYVILSTQWIDFCSKNDKDIELNQNDIRKCVYGADSIDYHLRSLNLQYFKESLKYNKKHHKQNSYQFLGFNANGDAELDLKESDINPQRWSGVGDEMFVEENFKSLHNIAQYLKSHNIKFIVTVPPYRSKIIDLQQPTKAKLYYFLSRLHNIAIEENFYLYDLHKYNANEDFLFADQSHLNKNGAILYSKFLAEQIQQDIAK